MNIIKFIHNWNCKLSNKVFTTIRKYTYKKEMYYRSVIDAKFEVILNGNKIREAVLVDVEIANINDLPFGLLATDTAITSKKDVFRLFKGFGVEKDTKVIILTFKTI